jgi:hypothetical protein
MKTHAKTRMLGSLVAAVAAAALTVPTAFAAGPGGPGGGGGGGGGGGSGGDTTGSLYSELVLALRAENGTPILKKYVVPPTEETPEETTEYCVQPISYEAVPGVASSVNPVDGRTVWVLPLQGEWIENPPTGPLPVDEIEACDPKPQYAMFVKEAELERLNLARTADDVIAQKIADVQMKLRFADEIALESTGRIRFDETTIDASPENAAMYQSLMKTGTIPGLPADLAGPPAEIGPTPADGTSNSQFDAWELAAMTIGAAASKFVPLSIDAVEYYNRVIGFPPPADPTAVPPVPEYVSPWGVSFVRSEDPDNPGNSLPDSELFVDYSGFTYNRSQTFKGSVTWLDVPTLTWKVSRITDVVPFTTLSTPDETGSLTGIAAFAQLADDVRALCNFIPDNTYLPGFSMDVPGVDTTDAQLSAIRDPAVDLGTLPENVFQTFPFEMTASLLNPWGGTLIDEAQLLIRIDAETAFTAPDIIATAADGQSVPFTVDGDGNLLGKWGPDTGFPVDRGYNVSTTFDVIVADGAPLGDYTVTLALVDIDDPTTVLAEETGTIFVNANTATVLWGDTLPKYVTQGVAMTLPLQVYAPPEAGTGELTLTVAGPGDDPTTLDVVEATQAGDVKVYASDGLDMVSMPLSLVDGKLVGTWTTPLEAGFTPVTWYVTVAEGALVGNYQLGVTLTGGNTLDPLLVVVFPAETHGEIPPDAGEDTTAPVVTVEPGVVLGSTATFTFAANEDGVTFECVLTTDGVAGIWEACTSPKAYTDLAPGDYTFSVRGTDRVGLVSVIATRAFTVDPPADTTAPVVTINSDGTPGSTATFNLTADEPDVTFECQLTKNSRVVTDWAACESTVSFAKLSPGTYVLSVRGTDAAGNVSSGSAIDTHEWTVSKSKVTTKSK